MTMRLTMLMAEMARIVMMFIDEILESGDTEDSLKSCITEGYGISISSLAKI